MCLDYFINHPCSFKQLTPSTIMMIFAFALCVLAAPLAMGYDEKFDKVDVDKILGDEELFNAYIACLLDKGPCSVENSEDFRKILPEVIETSCEKCSTIQKANVRKSVKALQDRKPAEFQEFGKKYDPKGEHIKKFTEFLFSSD